MALPNFILFLLSASILFFVLRFRVHIHLVYQNPQKPSGNHPQPSKSSRLGHPEAAPEVVVDLASALQNLGCKVAKARQIAEKVYQQAPQANFTFLLKQAIREAA